MSEGPGEGAPANEGQGDPQNDNGGQGDNDLNVLPKWARDSITKANREAATYRKKAQEAEPILRKYKESEDAKKSETERLTTQLNELKSRAEKAELAHLRVEVGLAKGLTAAQSKRLTGATKEELEADADDLIETFGTSKPASDGKGKPNLNGRPKEKIRGGADPEDDGDETDAKKILAKVPRLY